jgi:hypothetical protein
VRVKLLLVQAY